MDYKSWWESSNPLPHTTHKTWSKLCYGVDGFCQLQNGGFAPGESQIESSQLSQHTAASRDPI